jgi:hypothetical protein
MLTSAMPTARGRFVVSAVAILMLGGLLAGCIGGGDDAPEAEPTTTAADGLTAPGTDLRVDDAAVVDFAAGKGRESKIRLTVTRVQDGSVKDLSDFDLNGSARKSGVYYVRASVRNVGHGDVGGAFVTLYGRVSDSLVVRPVIFGSTFGKCDYKPLPKPFGSGKRADVCMVLLAPRHGTVSAVEWRFTGKRADAQPISWELS